MQEPAASELINTRDINPGEYQLHVIFHFFQKKIKKFPPVIH